MDSPIQITLTILEWFFLLLAQYVLIFVLMFIIGYRLRKTLYEK